MEFHISGAFSSLYIFFYLDITPSSPQTFATW